MNKIEQLNRTNLRKIRDRIDEALAPLGEELGMTFSAGTASFSEKNGSFKLKMVVGTGEDAKENSAEAEAFRNYAFRWGLSPDDLGKSFKFFGGEEYTIVGAKPRASKYPILARKTSDGKTYKVSSNMVANALIAMSKN